MYPVYYTASIVKILTYVIVFKLQWRCLQSGLVTSGVLLFYWSLSAVTGAVTFRSVLMSGHLSGDDKVLPLITAAIQYPMVVGAFFLSCWSDPKPRYIDVNGK